jgi:hypothetical protein
MPASLYMSLENAGHFSCLDAPAAVIKIVLEN